MLTERPTAFTEGLGKLERIGYKHYNIEPKSLGEMLKEEGQSGQKHFGSVNPYKPLRDFKPAATIAAIRPKQLYIPDSNLLRIDERYGLIERINSGLREEGITDFEATMPDPSTLAQLDLKYREETGSNLIVNLYAYATTATTETSEPETDYQIWAVGRIDPNGKLTVVHCSRDRDSYHVFLIPVFIPVLR